MKKTYITIIILVILVLVIFVFTGKGKKLEAPTVNNEEQASIAQEEALQEQSTVSVKEYIVSGKDFSFEPNVLTVKKGDKVKITFTNTQGFHDFKIDEFGLATKQAQSPNTEVLEFTADKIGSFEYYCSVGKHRSMGMKGVLNVTE